MPNTYSIRTRVVLSLACLLVTSAPRSAFADSFTVAWDPNTESVAGYYVFIGTASGAYSTVVDVGNATTYTYSSAAAGTTYYLTVAAYASGPLVGPKAPELIATGSGTGGTGGTTLQLTNPGNQTGSRGTTVNLALSSSSPSGTALVYGASGLPPGLALDPLTGLISGTAGTAGTFKVTVTVADSLAHVSMQSFTWTITTADASAPTMFMTGPTTGTSYSTSAAFITLTGTADDDTGVTSVTWSNSRGGSGPAAGTSSWSVIVPVQIGTNLVSMTATDAAKRSTSIVLTVTRTSSPTPETTTPGSLPTLSTAPTAGSVQMPSDTQVVGTTTSGTTLQILSMVADPSGQLPTTIRATAIGGVPPYQYKWWLWTGSTWQMLLDWSPASAYTWSSATAGVGYRLAVWVRSAGSQVNAPDNDDANKSIGLQVSGIGTR